MDRRKFLQISVATAVGATALKELTPEAAKRVEEMDISFEPSRLSGQLICSSAACWDENEEEFITWLKS
jgi:hypothetical protein